MFFRSLWVVLATCFGGIGAHATELAPETLQNHIIFSQGGTVLDETAMEQLALLGRILNIKPLDDACIRLVGYSDSSGGQQINQKISRERAEAVAEVLGTFMSDSARIESIVGLGAVDFLVEIPKSDSRQRRVAIQARRCS